MGAATNLKELTAQIDRLVAANPGMTRQEAAAIVISSWPIKGQEPAEQPQPQPQQTPKGKRP